MTGLDKFKEWYDKTPFYGSVDEIVKHINKFRREEKKELSLAELADDSGYNVEILLRRGNSLTVRHFESIEKAFEYLRGIK